MVPILSAAAAIAVGAAFGLSPSGPAAGEAVHPVDEPSMASSPIRGIDRMVVYGHSMPTGGGASDASLGYAEVAAEESGLQLLNRADGKTLAGMAARAMGTFFAARPSDVVVIHTGMNDIIRRGDDAAAMGRDAIERMLSRSADAALVVLLLECRPPSWEGTPTGRDREVARELWNDMLVDEAAAAGGVVVIDSCATWDPELNVDPGEYHPNDAGHVLIAEALVASLAEAGPPLR